MLSRMRLSAWYSKRISCLLGNSREKYSQSEAHRSSICRARSCK